MTKAKKVIGKLLLAFVLVSIGFAIGQETARSRLAVSSEAAPEHDKVVVYYLHATFRCVTCNEAEVLAATLVLGEFAPEVEAERLEWRSINFQDRVDLADRYHVSAPVIVIAAFRDGAEVWSQRLDRTLDLVGNASAFNDYLRAAINAGLGEIQ